MIRGIRKLKLKNYRESGSRKDTSKVENKGKK